MELSILPCPFCGRNAVSVEKTQPDAEGSHYVYCLTCHARGGEARFPDTAVIKWNNAWSRDKTFEAERKALKERCEMFQDALRGMIGAYEILEKEVMADE